MGAMKNILITIAAVVLVGCGPSVPDISIHVAVKSGNIEAVKQHLAAGTDVNAKSKGNGWTPLFYATSGGGQKEIAELLIAEGANVNAKDKLGDTSLQVAAYQGHKEIAELLIAKGADVNAKDGDGVTPLDLAIRFNRTETAELLIAKGADVNAKGNNGETPLDLAILVGRDEIADLLRKHGGKTGEELKAEGK